MYQTHPRTKGSTGYPDKILATEHFRDNRYWGAGWKAMPADLSQPALGMRSLRLLDDLAAAGYRKRLLGEVDVFQVDSTHELYAHMNINYVRADTLPSFDRYGELLNAMDRGEFFVSTGEVLLPEVRWERQSGRIRLAAQATWRFPLAFAEIVWGDGEKVHRTQLDLTSTRAFGSKEFQWELAAPGWRWARLAVWDVAGNGAFTNPEWREQ